MKSFTITAAATSVLFGVCLFISGCGASPANRPKAEMSEAMMTPDTQMSGNMASDSKMSPTDTMSDSKIKGMADGKMEESDTTDK